MITVNQITNTSDGVYTYRLKSAEAGSPMPVGSIDGMYTFAIIGNASAEIEMPAYSLRGVYYYELSQIIDTEKPGYIYDKRSYTVKTYVGDTLETTIIVLDNEYGVKTDTIIFQNEYHPITTDPGLMPNPLVRNTVFGKPGESKTFAFALEARDSSNPMPQGGQNGIKTIYITGSGKKGFGVWSYDRAGVYYYRVYEIDDGMNEYDYDSAEYAITDMVTEENGRLILSRVVTNGAYKPVTSFIFNNYYRSGGGEDISGGGEDVSGGGERKPSGPLDPSDPVETGSNSYNPVNSDRPDGAAAVNPDSDNRDLHSGTIPGSHHPRKPKMREGDIHGLGVRNESPVVNINVSENSFESSIFGSDPGPKTGDDSDPVLYITLFIISGAAAAVAAFYLICGEKYDMRRGQT